MVIYSLSHNVLVLRGVHVAKPKEVTGKIMKIYNEDLHNFISSLNNIKAI